MMCHIPCMCGSEVISYKSFNHSKTAHSSPQLKKVKVMRKSVCSSCVQFGSVISDWSKYKPHLTTQWCTVEGRDIIDYNLSRLECQVRCEEKGPTCTAVEYWEEGNHACFECTDRNMITRYTNTTNPDYPVYVWVR